MREVASRQRLIVLGALAASPVAAFVGNRIGSLIDAAPDHLAAVLEAPLRVWGDIVSDPIFIGYGKAAVVGSLLAICAPWCTAMAALLASREGRRAGAEFGSERWATARELEPFRTRYNPEPNRDCVLLSDQIALATSRTKYSRVYDRNLNVLVLGGTGSNKTTAFVLPNLCQLNADYIITDPKGDLILKTGGMFERNGYEVSSFNTFLPSRSQCYNPLAYVKTDLEIIDFAHLLISMTTGDKRAATDPFWPLAETLLYMTLIAFQRDYLPAKDFTIDGLLTLISMASAREDDEQYRSPLDLVFEEISSGVRLVRCDDEDTAVDSERDDAECAEERVMAERGGRWHVAPSTFRRASDGLRPYDHIKKDGSRGFADTDDFALLNYMAFKKAAGKTMKSIIISCNTRLSPFTASEVRHIVCGKDEMHLGDFGGEPTLVFSSPDRNGGPEHIELTESEARSLRANGAHLEPCYTYRVGARRATRKERAQRRAAIKAEAAAQKLLDGDFEKTIEFLGLASDVKREDRPRPQMDPESVPVLEVLSQREAWGLGLLGMDRQAAEQARGVPRETKRALFAIFDDVHPESLGFLHGLLVYQTIGILCRKALESFGGKLPRLVHLMLDEYRSLNLPSSVSGLISVIRSRNISMSVLVQGISQLEELYGPDTSRSIIACFATVLYMGSPDQTTTKFVSDLCGQMTVLDENTSSQHGGSRGWSKSGSKHARALIDPTEVAGISPEDCILRIQGAHPFIGRKYDYTTHENFPLLDSSFDFKKLRKAPSAAARGPGYPARPRAAKRRSPRDSAPLCRVPTPPET